MPHLNYNMSFGSICLFVESFYLLLFFLIVGSIWIYLWFRPNTFFLIKSESLLFSSSLIYFSILYQSLLFCIIHSSYFRILLCSSGVFGLWTDVLRQSFWCYITAEISYMCLFFSWVLIFLRLIQLLHSGFYSTSCSKWFSTI